MDRNESIVPQGVVPTGGNAQELMVGTSRRQPTRPVGETTIDPLTQGFDTILARFDRLETRIDNLESPGDLDPDPPYDDDDDDDPDEEEYRAYRGSFSPAPRRNRRLGFREGRSRRDEYGGGFRGRDIYRGRGRATRARGDRRQHSHLRAATCWDPLAGRNSAWQDRRQPSCWDPPYQRGQHYTDSRKGVKMSAPHFDGGDASNWISRVQYYFDHLMMPDEDRLHYVVMLFDPPAAEWIFNYCANNDFVTMVFQRLWFQIGIRCS